MGEQPSAHQHQKTQRENCLFPKKNQAGTKGPAEGPARMFAKQPPGVEFTLMASQKVTKLCGQLPVRSVSKLVLFLAYIF